jgi:hypothetical protein|tara:strand:+ start:306 stop:425 length:120 start_codon:yes stop_codon:yes gene_type:complete
VKRRENLKEKRKEELFKKVLTIFFPRQEEDNKEGRKFRF